MPKDPSPLLGYNNNIRHKSRVFHVQTEDSGVRHPHIITHLFMDGGRILKSIKTSYAEHLGAEKMADLVRLMMKDQHKSMLMALRDGQYDDLVEGGAAPAEGAPARKAAAGAKPAAAEPAKPRAASVRPPAPMTMAELEDGPVTARNPNPPEELTLDIEALERAAADSSSPLFQQSDLPPPPANLFRERGGGGYSALTPGAAEDTGTAPGSTRPAPGSSRPAPGSTRPGPGSGRPGSTRPGPNIPQRRGASSRPPPASQRRGGNPAPAGLVGQQSPARPPVRPKSSPPTSGPTSEGRYAPARAAAIFGQSKPPRGHSIFGEDLISDKSLDEVILSYLAEDLGAPSEKKKK